MSDTNSTTIIERTVEQEAEIRAWCDGLRELADTVERGAPHAPAGTFRTFLSMGYENPAAVLTATARRMGGKWQKAEAQGDFELHQQFGPHRITLFTRRENVCERVVTGTRTVTETIPDPSVEVPTIEVTREVEDVEWICPPSLLALAEAEA